MKDSNETTAYRVTITLDSAKLPVDEQARNALLTEFRSRVGHLVDGLRGIDVEQDDIDISTGYRYAQVPATCPLCSERLDLQSVHLDTENGALAAARSVRAMSVTGAVMQFIESSTSRAAKATPSRVVY